ncbi:hypothetical protein SCHPADRAFT_357691 [Schizopora paradoxa]|uniref:GPI mannosyltransferase 1 n=1 Tax=Schizopora paradoxa TaxID=27342 RepID=A0A0H2RVQ2_9AGAM|nr:hypothetical protein SCHPADRAFT_357691 [Schizopora paradoxa]
MILRNFARRLNITNVVIASIAIHVALVFYSEWYDQHTQVGDFKYTDIDYEVFTDAARYLWDPSHDPKPESFAQGPLGKWLNLGNPYGRDTYRYTPLLALLLTPNIWLHRTFGKLLFSACDIVVGLLLYRILFKNVLPTRTTAKSEEKSQALECKALAFASLYLLNPFVITISTRGSSESTLGALVLLTLYYALSNNRLDSTAVMLGVATHWKIYPFIYAASLAAVLAREASPGAASLKSLLVNLVNRKSIRLALLSFGTFMALNAAMYLIWGYPFVFEAYLYHLHRLDHRHNFSPYWLPTYLSYQDHPEYPPPYPGLSSVMGKGDQLALWRRFIRSPLASFVPQMLLSLGSGLIIGSKGRKHLPFAWFIQTAAFVTLNRVCTSQYFLWYLTILPLVLPAMSMSLGKAVSVVALWVGAQGIWLHFAYKLEFLKMDTYYEVWGCSVLLLLVNFWAMFEIIKSYRWEAIASSSTAHVKAE